MSPVLCMSLPLQRLSVSVLHNLLYALITYLLPYPKRIHRWRKSFPPRASIGFQMHTGNTCFYLLEGKSLVLLKTNFSKKPKNPV